MTPNTTRNGKIARLPRSIRDQLNQRLDDNHKGPDLLKWLNDLPEAQAILTQHFEGNAITPQNLSEWRKGGFLDWFKLQHVLALTREFITDYGAAESGLNSQKISEALNTMVAIDFSNTVKIKLENTHDTDQRLECHYKLQNHICRLRREDCRVGYYQIRQERWDNQQYLQKRRFDAEETAAEAAAEVEKRRQMLAHFQLQPDLAKKAADYGGTDMAWNKSAFLLELEHKLKSGTLGRTSQEYVDQVREFAATAFPADQSSEGRVSRVPNIDHTESNPTGRAELPLRPNIGSQGSFGVPSRTRDGGTQGEILGRSSNSALPVQTPNPKQPESSIDSAPASRTTHPESTTTPTPVSSTRLCVLGDSVANTQNPNKSAKIQVHPTTSNLQKN